jgi:ribosomal protein S18 acetylase RimI-like enzyme
VHIFYRFFLTVCVFFHFQDGKWEMEGVALWLRPSEKKRPPVKQVLRVIAMSLKKYPRAVLKGAKTEIKFTHQVMNMLEQQCGKEQWVLLYVGVDPEKQSSGVGTRLLNEVLAGTDADTTLGVGTVVTNERNVKYFERLGFSSEKILTPKHDGIKTKSWLLARPPGYVTPSDANDAEFEHPPLTPTLSALSMSCLSFSDVELGARLAEGFVVAIFIFSISFRPCPG